VAVTLKVALPPSQIVIFCGGAEIIGNVFTVSIAPADMPGVQVPFVTTALYRLLFKEGVAAVTVKVAVVAPPYTPPFVMLV
jgi:hypothetical protein